MALITDQELIDGFNRAERYRYPCPVCGLDWRWTVTLEDIKTSFDICPQCGIEFGYEDTVRTHEELRVEWEHEGKQWHSRVVDKAQYQRCLPEIQKPPLSH